MKIVNGTARKVYVFNKFVIKIPQIEFRLALTVLWEWFCDGELLELIVEFDYSQYGTVHMFLFRGIVENWHEFIFYRKHKLKVSVPTYFSFLGLFNIQKKVEALEMDPHSLWLQFLILTNGMSRVDEHIFDHSNNFTRSAGYLQAIDYGNFETQHVLLKYSEAMTEKFDFAFDKDEYRRKSRESRAV